MLVDMNARRRLPIGQLLVRMLRSFREDLYRRGQEAGYHDIREAHLQVFGALDWTGTRLTELAARSNMTRPSMSELVDELQQLGYLERRPDPSDGRAKLIRPTRKGRRLLVQALRAVEEIERGYGDAVGTERFEAVVATIRALLDAQGEQGRPNATEEGPRYARDADAVSHRSTTARGGTSRRGESSSGPR